jgi:hypothetical protein
MDGKEIAFGLISSAPSTINADSKISLQMFYAEQQPLLLDISDVKAMHFTLVDIFETVNASSLVPELAKVNLTNQSTINTTYTLSKQHRKLLCQYAFEHSNSYNCNYITDGIL